MRGFLVLVVLCLCFEKGQLALPTCSAVGACAGVETAECKTAGSPCTCKTGFHENSTGTGCDKDLLPGETCPTINSEIECTDGAQCINVAPSGSAVQLQCLCKSGYHRTTDVPSSCGIEIEASTRCQKSAPSECDSSECTQKSLGVRGCSCKPGFHLADNQRLVVCNADIGPGGTCQKTEECAENSDCLNTASPGAPEALKCVCQDGFHSAKNAEGIASSCESNKGPDSTCTASEECIENSTCQLAADNVNRCTCIANFHATNGTCKEDTCQHTDVKCAQAEVADCNGANNFVGCMLDGKCDPADNMQLMRFEAAITNVRSRFPDDCAYSASTTCSEQVIGCMNAFLKINETCSTIRTLKTCTDAFSVACSDSKELKLANALQVFLVENRSCDCLDALESCRTTQQALYTSATDNATKCRVSNDLLTCALGQTGKCDQTKAADHQAMTQLVTLAFTWTANVSCDTSTQPTSCDQQLARCVVILGAERKDDFKENCRAIEEFGNCVQGDKCGADDTNKTIVFMEHYNATSSTCKCPNQLDRCNASSQIIPMDPAMACPKLVNFATCVMGAECSLMVDNNDLGPLDDAHEFYKVHLSNRTCKVESDGTCSSDVGVCANTLITSLMTATSTTTKCTKTGDSLLCVNGANCRSTLEEDYALLSPSREAARFRLKSIDCAEPSCSATNDELVDCSDKYDNDFKQATKDSTKCTVRNTFVLCLRRLKCNSFMKPRIEKKYQDISLLKIPSCSIHTLDEPTTDDAVRSASVDLLTVLLAATVGVLAAVRL